MGVLLPRKSKDVYYAITPNECVKKLEVLSEKFKFKSVEAMIKKNRTICPQCTCEVSILNDRFCRKCGLDLKYVAVMNRIDGLSNRELVAL